MNQLPDVNLALLAAHREGRDPRVVSHSWWMANKKDGDDYLVLQDETWKEWVRS
jgi:hypothetical protein